MSHFPESRTLNLLVRIAKRSYQKVPEKMFASAKIGNACIHTLAGVEGMDGFANLTRLAQSIRAPQILRSINTHIEKKAEAMGLTTRDIEELSVPDFGLKDGVIETEFGDYTFKVDYREGFKPKQSWINKEGKTQRGAPVAVKNDKLLKKKLRDLKEDLKLLQTQVTTQKNRLDLSYLRIRSWSFETFQKHYLEHPLLSMIASKFVWSLVKREEKQQALWRDNRWENVTGNPLSEAEKTENVELWHPMESTLEEIFAWRERLEELNITQPFKQAYREVYLLTDAERETEDYSNRMAAHILYQSQFKALAQLKGWGYRLLGNFDNTISHSRASLYLGNDLTAHLQINVMSFNGTYNRAGTWDHVGTDFLTFERKGENVPLDLIPPMIFSEVMRNIDMFVGVTSIGNNPEWLDHGENPDFDEYWHDYSFNQFPNLAKTRKIILEKLLPRLKIKNVASIDGHFLRVKGKLHTYKIHIGSTNILVEPDNQYLCIVPARSKKPDLKKIYLPFEGGSTLPIILSKAFMLADDDKITDSQILGQLKGGRGE